PTADVGLEVEVQRRTAPSVVQVHGRAPVVAPDEAGERSHARARADQYDGLARAAQGETGIAADEGLRGVARLQVMKVGGAQAARQLAHADLEEPVFGARGERVVARHAGARRDDAHQVARRETREATPAQAIEPARTRPAKTQDRRGPVRLARVVLARYQRERRARRHARYMVQRERLAEGTRQILAP